MTELPEKYRTDLAIVRETAEQLIRDFNWFNIGIRFSGDPLRAYDELREQIVPLIDRMQREEPGLFQSLLYRIDLDERKFRRQLSAPEAGVHIADLILQRELQKVLTRRYFSDTSSGKSETDPE
jgi:hypothetical protein